MRYPKQLSRRHIWRLYANEMQHLSLRLHNLHLPHQLHLLRHYLLHILSVQLRHSLSRRYVQVWVHVPGLPLALHQLLKYLINMPQLHWRSVPAQCRLCDKLSQRDV